MRLPRYAPRVDRLEDRATPALSVTALSGILLVRGVPNGDVQINALADNRVELLDNGVQVGLSAYDVPGRLFLQFPRRPSAAAVTVDLNDFTLDGDLFIDLGEGDANATLASGIISVIDGTLGGNVTVLRGDGRETYEVGGN